MLTTILLGSIGQLQLTLHQRLYSRTEIWRGVCLLTDRAVYNIIKTVFTSMTMCRDVSLPDLHPTDLLQTFTCAIDINNQSWRIFLLHCLKNIKLLYGKKIV